MSTIHHMNLHPQPFDHIKSGQKTVEMRLCDEKRQAIRVGDVIEFTCRDTGDTMTALVVDLRRYPSFEELYEHEDHLRIGYEKGEIASPADMRLYYTDEDIARYACLPLK